jgi:DNA-binding CsgD family transcriptional regulator
MPKAEANLSSSLDTVTYTEPPASAELGCSAATVPSSPFSDAEDFTKVSSAPVPRLALASTAKGGRRKDTELRERAIHADSASDEVADLLPLWQAMLSGDLSIADSFHSESRCYIVLRQREAKLGFSARKLSVLERALLGGRHKATINELKISASTLSMLTRQALSYLGLDCTPSKVPLLLCVLARATRPGAVRRSVRSSVVRSGEQELQVLSMGRPDLSLRARLSVSEFAVLTGLVEGKSHKQIAKERNASAHTIANQLTSAFKRLSVSGRLELLQTLASQDAASTEAEPTPESSRRLALSHDAVQDARVTLVFDDAQA